MSFDQKKVGEFDKYKSWKDLIDMRFLLKSAVIALSVFVIFLVGKFVLGYAKQAAKSIGIGTAKFLGEQVGEQMLTDEYGNINVLVIGYAGVQERGSYLTDTIMLASYNPSLGAVTFLSVPRDLYVSYDNGYQGKINGMLWSKYMATESMGSAARSLSNKVEEISGVTIPYYMLVDFDGFVTLIDTLGGINVHVPETLHDPYYPAANNSYQTFHIDQGPQLLDGETALKYARSRQTTSDFSRALRQQQIVEGVINEVLASINLTSISDLKETYEMFTQIVQTNVSLKEILGMIKYLDQERSFFSFVYTADCNDRALHLATPGCELYHGSRDAFGGQAVMLPDGATPGNLDYFKNTQDFAFWVVHNQEYLIENVPVTILNGIDREVAREQGYRISGVATDVAIELQLRAFNIADIDNADESHERTTVYTTTPERHEHTLEILRAFVDIAAVNTGGTYGSGNMTLILGNDYLSKL